MSVTAMQRSLQRAVARASLADDRDLAGRIRDEGQRVVFLLNGLVRSSRLYQADNAAVRALAVEGSELLKRLLHLLGAVHIVAVEDQIYLNEVRVRMKKLEQELLDQLMGELERHEVGSVSFHEPLDPEDLKALARALAGPAGEGGQGGARHPPGRASGGGAGRQVPVPPEGRADRRTARRGRGPPPRGHVARGDPRAARGGPHPPSAARPRVVIDLVDALGSAPDRAARACLRRSVDAVGTQHLLSVASLALQLGRAVGLPDATLSDLGVAAMLHDVGSARASDRGAHEIAGARMLARQRGFHEGKVRRLQATLEHHLPAEARPCLFARILRIVDDYDVLTAPRPGLPQLPPATAQAAMWAARGSVYDADLLALFVQGMGLYPPGSRLELSDGRWVVSVSGGRDSERFAWPLARVIRDKEGHIRDGREETDLYVLREFLRPNRVLNPGSLGPEATAAVEMAVGGP